MKLKAYKYRIYPTKDQEILLNKTFGCCRYVYNRCLDLKIKFYEKEKKSLSLFKLINEVPKWKKQEETKWLNDISAQSLQSSLRNLDIAYTKFFKQKIGFPKFKNKSSKQSFTNPQKTKVNFNNSKVYIMKFKEGIKCIFDRKFTGKIKSSTVSKTPTGKYFISILVEENIDNPIPPKSLKNKTLGIDLGIKNYLTDSNGEVVENPRFFSKKLKMLRRQQRKLSRKKKGSSNREKQRKVVARVYEKVTNVRNDFLHKLTTKLAKNQGYTSIAIEDLDVQSLLSKGKKNKLSCHITDAAWGTFRKFLEYKCQWYGKNLLVIGRFEPSSKLCTCGHLNSKLKLKEREWECEKCGAFHLRDVLAAQNIRRFAFCKQNTKKDLIGQGLPEFTPVETRVSESRKQELIAAKRNARSRRCKLKAIVKNLKTLHHKCLRIA